MRDPKRGVKLAKMFQEVLDVDKDLAKIEDLEQARHNAVEQTVEAQRITAGNLAEQVRVEQRLMDAQDDLKLAKKEAEDTLSLAKQAAQEIVLEAKKEAKVIVVAALQSEEDVVDRMAVDQERHATIMRDYASLQEKARDSLNAIEKELEELRARISPPLTRND